YFGYLDKGYHDDSTHIFAYNGGLFATDSVLDNLIISDEVLHPHIKKLAEYDFASEVDVNILGHIFENSLNEIEEIQNQLQGISTDKKQSKRKKDGVFYTPKYITKYIVENTVGKLCTDKKSELGIIDEDFYKPKRLTAKAKEIIKSQADKLTAYRSWLLQLTICDPACGSGAFLNEALNFLIAEHRYIDELTAKLYGDSLVYQDVENSILENNLFGVDINEESVDIAKLSLWLRTAKPKRKLSSLNNNIKCGNSLISDKAIGGEKAFDWQKEFPQVFAKGGFDVVIGNPPYVKLEQIKQISEQLEQMNYQTYAKRGDLYVLFVEKGFELLKTGGFVSYIMPNKWLQADYGKYLRKYFLENNIFELIDFGDLQIFEGATTYPCIFNSQKDKPNDTIKTAILNKNFKNDFNENIKQNEQILATSEFDENTWVISSAKDKAILDKVCAKFEKLSDFVDEANYGVKTGFSKAFFIDEIKKNEIINEDMISSKIIFPFVQGRDISRYGYTNIENYLIGTFPAFSLNIDEFIGVKNHLLSFGKERLEQSGKKGSRKKTTNKWFETSDSINYYKSFEEPKIMYQKFQVKPCFIFDESGLYCNDSMWIIPTDNKGLLAILNSKMGWWLISKYCTQIQNGYQLIWKYFGQIPIAPPNNELAEKADKMLILNKDLQTISGKFIRTLQRKFEILEKLPKKLENWYELNFAEFVKELNKKKIKLTLSEESDWEDFFLTEQKKALSVQREITITDKEIDTMVYRLYDLTDEEITIIEG
ncbi:MAG: N-6 DNA methylase, partial [Gammaproteobacteria bacterium]|nr:N-6 DNA methylase [Gammaproteobacteria bacterium]